jgi:hypothetical protein
MSYLLQVDKCSYGKNEIVEETFSSPGDLLKKLIELFSKEYIRYFVVTAENYPMHFWMESLTAYELFKDHVVNFSGEMPDNYGELKDILGVIVASVNEQMMKEQKNNGEQ